MTKDDTVHKTLKLVERIHPILAGNEPAVIGAVLCELLALVLAGHTIQMREKILQHHVEYLYRLINVNAKFLDTPNDDDLITGPHSGQYH